jgi:spore germination cell wall hydrolase CwlJ-like protein
LKPPKYRQRRSYTSHYDFEYDHVDVPVARSGLKDIAPYIFGGTMLIAAFAFAGHQLGRNAIASTMGPDIEVPALAMSQTKDISEKGSLLATEDTFTQLALDALRQQTVLTDGKGDMALSEDTMAAPELEVAAVAHPKPILKPVKRVEKIAKEERMRIEPAAINLKDDDAKLPAKKQLASVDVDPVAKPKLTKAEKQRTIAQRRAKLAEENCLARAVYFEARSESALGQMAVAKVILNRVKSPHYPNTICGVVYQGTQRRNSCQFSFACDGQPDDVRQPAAWSQAKSIAQRAIAGEMNLRGMGTATSYHADYVRPKWAKSLKRVTKIGTHVFYSGI